MHDILKARNHSELAEKFTKFKGQKALDSDPLVRWCPNPSCGEHTRAENKDAKKLSC